VSYVYIGLKNPLASGDHIKGTLVFEKAGTLNVEFDVREMGASSPDGKDSMPGMQMR
jgi:copper(I)-binding protein